MKMLSANEVQQVSGGDAQSDIDFIEWLRNLEDHMRRSALYATTRDYP
jgi:hypothetical protein